MASEKLHSRIGASSAERWMNCPGSVALCANAPEQAPSKYAEEGTLAHEVAELTLRGQTGTLRELKKDPRYTAEMFKCAEGYREFISHCNRNEEGKMLVEQSFNLSSYDPEAFGTSDACVVGDTDILTVDYKYGAGIAVEVKNNPQLRFYALGALFSLPKDHQDRIETVKTAVYQPRAPHEEGIARVEVLTKNELVHWGLTVLKPAMERTRELDAPCVSGSWCRWCPAITLCPHQGKLPVKVSAAADFAEPSFADKVPAPKSLSLEQIGIALEARDQIEAWFEAVELLARQALDAGKDVPGWKLVQGRKTKSWHQEEEVEHLLKLGYGEGAYVKKLLSPAAAMKVGFDAPHYIEETIGNPSLVRSSDKRANVQRSAITDFKGEDNNG